MTKVRIASAIKIYHGAKCRPLEIAVSRLTFTPRPCVLAFGINWWQLAQDVEKYGAKANVLRLRYESMKQVRFLISWISPSC